MTRSVCLFFILMLLTGPLPALAQADPYETLEDMEARHLIEIQESTEFLTTLHETGGRLLTAMELYWQKSPDDALFFAKEAKRSYLEHAAILTELPQPDPEAVMLFDEFIAAIEGHKGVATVDLPHAKLVKYLYNLGPGDEPLAISQATRNAITRARAAYEAGVKNGQVVNPRDYQLAYGYLQSIRRADARPLGPGPYSIAKFLFDVNQAWEGLLDLFPTLTGSQAPDAVDKFDEALAGIKRAVLAFQSE